MVSRASFLRRGFIRAVLKDAGSEGGVEKCSEKCRMSLETAWRRDEGIVSWGQVAAWLDVIILLTSSEVRGINWVKTEGGM